MMADDVPRDSVIVRVEYELNFEEFYEAYAATQRRATRRQYVLWAGVFLVGVALAALLHYRGVNPLVGYMFSLIALAVTLMLRPIIRAHLWRVFQRSGTFSEHTVAEFSSEGVRWMNPVVESFVRWHGFTHWNETPRSFLLFRGPDVAAPVPKRAMLDESQLLAFRELLIERVGRTSPNASRAFPVQSPSSQ